MKTSLIKTETFMAKSPSGRFTVKVISPFDVYNTLTLTQDWPNLNSAYNVLW